MEMTMRSIANQPRRYLGLALQDVQGIRRPFDGELTGLLGFGA